MILQVSINLCVNPSIIESKENCTHKTVDDYIAFSSLNVDRMSKCFSLGNTFHSEQHNLYL